MLRNSTQHVCLNGLAVRANATSRLCVVGLVLVAAASGSGAPKGAPAAVDVYLNDRDDSAELLGPGTPLASAIFKKIGVRLNWHTGELPPGPGAFGIRTVEHAPGSATSEALASARLSSSSGAEITVYMDRVRRLIAKHPDLAGAAAGYVLAHELAHAMQGAARHSASGILKVQWSLGDYKDMMFHKLAFTDSDVELIHKGLALQLANRRSELAVEAGSGSPAVRNLATR
jgi:hypothetical protein